MGRRSTRILGWVLVAVVAIFAPAVDAASLNKRARLRDGPSKESKLLGWIEDGTAVVVESERNGWYAVRTLDGQAGFIWQDHLRFDGTGSPAPAATPTAPDSPPQNVAPATEIRPIPPDISIAAELERIRAELARLATAQQELAQRTPHDGRTDGPTTPVESDGSAGAAVVFFGAGAVAGWLFGRFAPSRRERRSRLRL